MLRVLRASLARWASISAYRSATPGEENARPPHAGRLLPCLARAASIKVLACRVARVLGAQHILVQDEAQGLLGVHSFHLQVSGGLLRIRREVVVDRTDEKEDTLNEVIALGDGGHLRTVLTKAEGARVLEEGVVLLGIQAVVQGIVLEQRI